MGTADRKPRRWWPAVKLLLALLIVAAVARQFALDLARPELWQREVRVGWLLAAVPLYLLALMLSGLYWHRLLGWLGSPTSAYAALRAYYVSQPAKYVPGKALALAVRVGLVSQQGVPPLRAAWASFCEVLTTMAAGALLASALFLAAGPAGGQGPLEVFAALSERRAPELGRATLALLSLGLFALTCGPLLPPVVALANRLLYLVRRRLAPAGARPPARYSWLLAGLAMNVPGWLMLGLALACALQAIPGAEPDWGPASLARLTAVMGLSYVAGFVVIVPGGLGVREYLLTLVLVPDLIAREGLDRPTARGLVVLAVLLLRVAWTAAEAAVAGALYLAPPRGGKGVVACPS